MSEPRSEDIIRASEIGEYAYCARSWWLRRVLGAESQNTAALLSGQAAHSTHGRTVAAAQRQRRLAWLLMALAAALAVGAILLAFGDSLWR